MAFGYDLSSPGSLRVKDNKEEAMARSEGSLNIGEEDEREPGVVVIDPTWLETSVGIE